MNRPIHAVGLAAALLMLSAPATAQSTTNCFSNGAFTNCNTTAAPASPFALGISEPDDTSPSDTAMAIKQKRKVKATKLLGAGDCPGATKEAFRTGDMDFVEKVQAYCSAH